MDREPESSFTCAVRNLDIISLQDAVLPISNKEVFFNFSVCESIKIIDSTAVFLEDHQLRDAEEEHADGRVQLGPRQAPGPDDLQKRLKERSQQNRNPDHSALPKPANQRALEQQEMINGSLQII